MKYDFKEIYNWPLVPRSIVVALVCLIVFYLGYFLDLSGSLKQLKDAHQQEEDLKLQLVSLAGNIGDVRSELNKYPLLIDALEKSKKQLIATKELPELLNEILKMGTQNELEFNNFSPGAEMKENAFIKVPIKVVVIGTFDQIASYMSQIANMDKVVVISNFSISKPGQSKVETDQSVIGSRLIGELVLEVYEAKAL